MNSDSRNKKRQRAAACNNFFIRLINLQKYNHMHVPVHGPAPILRKVLAELREELHS